MRDAEGLLCLLTDRIDTALIKGCPRLRVISSWIWRLRRGEGFRSDTRPAC
jgi:hypothetical protein